jgi:hypothetical protein
MCSLPAPTLAADPGSKTKSAVPRPFYLIAHNPNTIDLARAFIASGVNALEPDLRFVDKEIRVHDQFSILGIRIRYPLFDGPGPTLSEYLRGLNEHNISPSLIAWDLKPPFKLAWMHEAAKIIRRDYGTKHPHTAMLFTVGSEDGLPELRAFASVLKANEAVGVDDFTSPAVAHSALDGLGKSYTYADRRRMKAIADAIAMRDSGKSFTLVYAWLVNEANELQKFLDVGLDGVIVDLEAVPKLRERLQTDANKVKFRLAEPSDKPF